MMTALATVTLPPPTSPPAPDARSEGQAFLRGHASRRPVWAVELAAGAGKEGVHMTRRFRGIADMAVAEERATLSPDGRLLRVAAAQPHLGEEAEAAVTDLSGPADGAVIRYRLGVEGQVREQVERVGLPVVTLSSLPVFAAAHGAELLAGRVLRARFPVLKVMRSATVTLRADRDGADTMVRVAPTNPLLRLLFGTTVYRFDAGMTALTGYAGVLDPRDRKPNGRWHEYRGHIALVRPLPLPSMPLPDR
ncbi:MAG: hypothetical protein RLY86_3200 [Pseudomonadota bacterium]|jgi:hypothetical protein